jgi:hypothetical protein
VGDRQVGFIECPKLGGEKYGSGEMLQEEMRRRLNSKEKRHYKLNKNLKFK